MMKATPYRRKITPQQSSFPTRRVMQSISPSGDPSTGSELSAGTAVGS
jgi:hypothetical protein